MKPGIKSPAQGVKPGKRSAASFWWSDEFVCVECKTRVYGIDAESARHWARMSKSRRCDFCRYGRDQSAHHARAMPELASAGPGPTTTGERLPWSRRVVREVRHVTDMTPHHVPVTVGGKPAFVLVSGGIPLQPPTRAVPHAMHASSKPGRKAAHKTLVAATVPPNCSMCSGITYTPATWELPDQALIRTGDRARVKYVTFDSPWRLCDRHMVELIDTRYSQGMLPRPD